MLSAMLGNELKGLLGRVARRNGEDTITEILAALGRHEELGVGVCAALLGEREGHVRKFETQYQGPEGERPDMVLQLQAETIIIESKFWADLQPGTQDKGYPESLKQLSEDDKPASLVFLVPESRRGKIVAHFRDKNIPVKVLTWELVVDELEALQKKHPCTDQRALFWLEEIILGIRRLAGIVKLESFEKSHLDDLNRQSTGQAINRLVPYVDRLSSKLGGEQTSGFAAASGGIRSGAVSDDLHYGFKIIPLGEQDILGWIGISSYAWSQGWPAFGLWLWRSKKGGGKLPPIESPYFDTEADDCNSRWVPLKLKTSPEAESLVDEWVAQLESIYDKLTAVSA